MPQTAGRAKLWEIRLAVELVLAHIRDLGVSIDGRDWLERAVDQVCEMQGIEDEADRLIVLNGVALNFGSRAA